MPEYSFAVKNEVELIDCPAAIEILVVVVVCFVTMSVVIAGQQYSYS
jgi:hypothetical protein